MRKWKNPRSRSTVRLDRAVELRPPIDLDLLQAARRESLLVARLRLPAKRWLRLK